MPENNGSEERATFLITFTCKHVRVFPEPAPKLGDVLWCLKCNADVRVESAPPEWRIRCEDCMYSPPGFGTGQINAEIAAAKHRMRKPGHVVRIINGRELVRTFGDRDQTVIPMSSESDLPIPF